MAEHSVPGCTIVDHPLVKTKVSVLRDKGTSRELFRRTLRELSNLVAFEATRDLAVVERAIETPLAACVGHWLANPVTIVPILRAGLGMAEALHDMLPEARMGHIGMYRDEETCLPQSYYFKAPPDLESADVLLVDPMLATGRSACDAAAELKARGARSIRLVAIIGCVPGAALFRKNHPDIPVYMAVMDSGLNEKSYIVPGLGDAGDRYFGT